MQQAGAGAGAGVRPDVAREPVGVLGDEPEVVELTEVKVMGALAAGMELREHQQVVDEEAKVILLSPLSPRCA